MTTDRWIALGAMLASIAAVFVSVSSDATQREHMRFSVRPIPSVLFTQTSDDLFVELKNVGTGPLILKEIKYTYRDGMNASTILDSEKFSKGTAGEVVLFELDAVGAIASGGGQRILSYDPSTKDFAEQIRNQALRTVLDGTTIKVEYTDVYDTNFETYEFTLKARNIIPQ